MAARCPPRDARRVAGNLPGQSAIAELLRAQSAVAPRSSAARLFGVSPLASGSRGWYETAMSETAVGEALAGLGDDWAVLHALPVEAGSNDIDHLVVGPGGIYIVNTEHHPGQAVWASQRTFVVSGARHPYIRGMEYEMGRVERLLGAAAGMPVEVAGILAVVGAKSVTVAEKHRDVAVLSTASLVPWLLDRPVVLDGYRVAAIAAAAGLEATWQSDVDPVCAPDDERGGLPDDERDDQRNDQRDDLRDGFAELRRRVRSAWRVQVAWATGTTVVGAGGLVLVTYSILLNTLGSLGTR